jgi:hypothetical protein
VKRDFIPGTTEREVAPNIVFRPIRSWHSGTYAGEKLRDVNGDRSGCLVDKKLGGFVDLCTVPYTVTHRIYWNKETGKNISAFLSYPGAMAIGDRYFWEIHPYKGDIARFDSEDVMERAVVAELSKP